MAIPLFGKTDAKKPLSKEDLPSGGERRYLSLFDTEIVLKADRAELLKEGLHQGLLDFRQFNHSRLKLAFQNFTEDMKKALYEVLFFLHVNSPHYAIVEYSAVEVQQVYGFKQIRQYPATACLYLEGAPAGVAKIDELSDVFREDCHRYWNENFHEVPSASTVTDFAPFVSIASLGSIGTIGHKPYASDLDIQIQYELIPFSINLSRWDDEQLLQALKTEVLTLSKKIASKKESSSPQEQAIFQKMALQQIQTLYPLLCRYLLLQEGSLQLDLASTEGSKLRQTLLHEMMPLIKVAEQRRCKETYAGKEALLKQRVSMIQSYVQKKFPSAEIYLFVCDNDSYRKGLHGTTLESKEASGSAYEKILTYDVLMPGIQFSPMIPTHFILPYMANNSPAYYERILDYMRFGTIKIYNQYLESFVDLGPTPSLTPDYILAHGGAVYWEAFKASSGNLAKSLLNLFRIEMLHDSKYLVTLIELIKNPTLFNPFIDAINLPVAEESTYGLGPKALLALESKFPSLLQDPWWTKYKVLKIAFLDFSYLDLHERKRISRIIDLCFALHIKVSDVFVKPGDTRNFDSYREQFLLDFLQRAFPVGNPQRQMLEHIHIGETGAVIQFEEDMKNLFKASMARVLEIQRKQVTPDGSNKQEFEIWYHYYQKNFDPPPHMIRRSILLHLKIPRLRIQAGFQFEHKIWLFRSLQTESKLGKRFDTFGVLDHLPDEIELMKSPSFLRGIASCILNSYYGTLHQGSLKEQTSGFEFDSASMKFGDPSDETYAYLRPDTVQRVIKKIFSSFPKRNYHYMDCIKIPHHYVEVIFFMHLMKFGQISVLYRDNLTQWYLDEWTIPQLRVNAKYYYENYSKTFQCPRWAQTLLGFLVKRDINLLNPNVQSSFWFNPHSAETSHGSQKIAAKEEDLASAFQQALLSKYQSYQEKQG